MHLQLPYGAKTPISSSLFCVLSSYDVHRAYIELIAQLVRFKTAGLNHPRPPQERGKAALTSIEHVSTSPALKGLMKDA
jgi:hypothetical protein